MEAHRQLKEVCGEAPWYVLHCPSCPGRIADTNKIDGRYAWAVHLHCSSCRANWWVCRYCPTQRSRLTTSRHLTTHKSGKGHLQNAKEDAPLVQNEGSMMVTGQHVVVGQPKTQNRTLVLNPTHFPCPQSIRFFQEADIGVGMMYLARRAILQRENSTDELDPDDVETFLETAFFVAKISRSQREDLATLLDRVCFTVSNQCERKALLGSEADNEDIRLSKKRKTSAEAGRPLDVKILTTKEEMRTRLLSGKFALFQNLPHPQVHSYDSHAYVMPTECLADFMAHGLADMSVSRSDQALQEQPLPHSTKAREILETNRERGVRTIFGSVWSDGFDPNTKLKNRGSAWVMTLTLETEVTGAVTIRNVYPLVVGKEVDDHRRVTRLIWEDFSSLTSTQDRDILMYCGREKREVKVSLHILAVSQDQPERRESTALLRGNSTYHARFGYCVNVKQIAKQMRPCVFCMGSMKSVLGDTLWEPQACDHCLNWMANEEKVFFGVEQDYPREMLHQSGKLQLRKLSFEDLLEAVSVTHDKVVTEAWDAKTAKAYLGTWCLPDKFKKEILLCAENCHALAKATREMNEEVINTLNIEAMENLDLHQQWKPPPVWQSGLEMWSIHETGMHLLFLGICESIVFEIENWAVKRKLNTSLGKQLLYLTAKIEKFHLSWCKVNQYKGDKLGGWISENYMAHSRLFAWYYSCLHVLAEDTPYEPPDKPRGRWNMLENKAWLRSRNLPVNGNAEELKERVTSNFNLPEAPPTGAPLTHVVDVVLTFWSMVSHLMGMKEGNTLTANVSARLIRVFLTAVYDLDELMAVPMDRKIPMWLSQYNFLCLLNLPEQIEKLGPIRNRWDGSIRGERFLQKAKPNVRSTRLKNWAENLMLNLLRQRELFVLREGKNRLAKLEVVGDDDNLSEGSDDENGGRPDLAAFYTYRCRTDVVRAREDEEPISVVLTQEEGQGPKAFVCYRGRHRSIMTCEMERFGTPTYYFGMHYHQFKLKSFESDHDEPLASIKIVCYGLLLPILKSGEETYAMVDSNWRVLNDHGQLVHPHVYLSANTH